MGLIMQNTDPPSFGWLKTANKAAKANEKKTAYEDAAMETWFKTETNT